MNCSPCLGFGKVPGADNQLVPCASCLGFGLVPDSRIISSEGSHCSGYLHVVKRVGTIEQIDAEIKALHAINSAKLPTGLPRDC